MNDPLLEDRIRRSFDEPARPLDADTLLQDVRRGAARRRARRTTGLLAAVVVAVAGIAVATTSGGPSTTPAPPATQPPRTPEAGGHGHVSGFWAVDTDRAVRVTQEHCRRERCAWIWTGDGHDAWTSTAKLHWPGDTGAGMEVGPVSTVRMSPDGRDGWAWGNELWSTHDFGRSWHRVRHPGAAEVVGDADGSAWAVVPDTGDLWRAPEHTDDWVRVSLPAKVTAVDAMAAVAGTQLVTWAGADARPFTGATMLLSRDGFASHREVAFPCTDPDVYHLVAGPHRFFLPCGSAIREHTVVWSSPDGEHWSRLGMLPRPGVLNQLVPTGDAGTLAAIDEEAGTRPRESPTFLLSGDEVTRVPLPGTAYLVTGQFVDEATGFLVLHDPDVVVRTDDGGRTWSRLP